MMFYKLENGQPKRLRLPLKVNDRDVFTNDENILNANGYYRMDYTEPPEPQEGVRYEPVYTVKRNVIKMSWNEVEDDV